ncbi:hypothetical protein HN51_023972 [Arachis hypogaea]
MLDMGLYSHHKPLTLFSAVTLTSLASPPWILPPSLQTRDLFRCHHWFSFTQSGATTVPCLDRHTQHCRLVVQQLVIPPLLGARAYEPGHSSLRSGAMAQLSTWSGQASLVQASNPTKRSLNHVPSPWCPHLSHKLALLNSAD